MVTVREVDVDCGVRVMLDVVFVAKVGPPVRPSTAAASAHHRLGSEYICGSSQRTGFAKSAMEVFATAAQRSSAEVRERQDGEGPKQRISLLIRAARMKLPFWKKRNKSSSQSENEKQNKE